MSLLNDPSVVFHIEVCNWSDDVEESYPTKGLLSPDRFSFKKTFSCWHGVSSNLYFVCNLYVSCICFESQSRLSIHHASSHIKYMCIHLHTLAVDIMANVDGKSPGCLTFTFLNGLHLSNGFVSCQALPVVEELPEFIFSRNLVSANIVYILTTNTVATALTLQFLIYDKYDLIN